MHSIVVATADEDLRAEVVERLAAEGRTAISCATWADTLARTAHEATKLVLVDGELPNASGALLDAVRRSVPHTPQVRVLRGALPPLEALPSPVHLVRLVHEMGQLLTEREAKLLPLVGIGPEPFALLQRLAASPLPVRYQGERGTGKQWLARLVHRLAGAEGPFVVLRSGETPLLREGPSGTVYVEDVEHHGVENVLATFALAEATGWRVAAGSRVPPDPQREGMGWTNVVLKPLRERPKDIRPVARLYLDDWRKRLGLPSRRVTAGLWQRIETYAWPGNHRELETFVVQAATSARGATLSEETVPRRVLQLLVPGDRDREDRKAFEELVEARLRPVVARHTAMEGAGLHQMVIDATERALLRLALIRTAGNQKAAAELLGIARNTLRERVLRLDPFDEGNQ
jgi:DNA-binding NtrC family response regulator